jgi:enediyne biosynthesis protein E4
VDVAREAGLVAPVIYGNPDSAEYILEAVGCGCASIDYDNDGSMDIFLLSGSQLAGPPPSSTNRGYKNNRDGTFTDVTDKSGLRDVGWVSAVCVGDYNNDGFDDLFCTYFEQNRLFRNNTLVLRQNPKSEAVGEGSQPKRCRTAILRRSASEEDALV